MKIKSFFILHVFFFFTLLKLLNAQQPIILTDSTSLIKIGKHIDLFEDVSNNLTIEKITSPEYQSKFIRSKQNIPNLGNTYSVLWCRLVLLDKSEKKWYLRITNPYIDTLQIYIPDKDTYQVKQTGRNLLFADREIQSTNFIFSIDIKKDTLQTVYIRVKIHLLYLPVQIGQLQPIMESESCNNFYFGFYFGIVFLILLTNFIMYHSIREKSLLYYIGYVASFGIYALSQKGYLIRWLPESLLWISIYSAFCLYTAGILIKLFTILFLRAKKNSPLFYTILFGLAIYGIVNLIIYLTGYRILAAKLLEIDSVITTIVIIIFSFRLFRKGYKPAGFYLIAFTFSLIGYCVFGFQAENVLRTSFLSRNSMIIGTLWEMIFLTLAISNKISSLRKEKEIAQLKTIEAAKEKELFITNQNIILERKVEERTKELEQEKRKSDNLLLNILPAETAEELKNTGKTTAKDFSEVTVLFTDFKNFSALAEKLSAQELVNEINHFYCAFDNIMTKYGIEKIKTIGDSYMCAGGLPVESNTNAEDTVNAALDILRFINDEKEKRMKEGLPYFEIRIGCHTGPVVAGIVGIKKFAYDIWGDTVNIAARMESSGEPGKVNISGSTYELVKDKFKCTYRGRIKAKNKGEIDMYFVDYNE